MKIKSMFLSVLALLVVTVGSAAAQTQKPVKDGPRVESKGEERLEHEAFKSARQQSQRLTKGIKLTATQLSQISLYRHAVLPDWNYTLLPNENRN